MAIKDDTSKADKQASIGYVVARDTFLSGWGEAKHGKSYVARPVRSDEELKMVKEAFEEREEFKNVRFVLGEVDKEGCRIHKPRLGQNDHLHIYGYNTFLHDFYVSTRYPFRNLFQRLDKEARAAWSQLVSQQDERNLSIAYVVSEVYANRNSEESALRALQNYED